MICTFLVFKRILFCHKCVCAYTCSDGSVVMLSTAILRTENSGDFNGTGLKPEFDVALSSEIDLNQISDEAALLTDAQLIKALEVTVPKETAE